MKITTFSERLRIGLNTRSMKPSELSQITSISKSSISRYLKGDWEGKQDAVYKIALALNVDEAWLMGYDVPMERKNQYNSPTVTQDVVVFPIIGDIAAGYDQIAMEDWSGETIEIPASYLRGRSKEDYIVLTVKGDSMYPLYQQGDKVLILKQESLNHSGEIGAVLYDDECATIKKVEYVPGEDWMRLVPINPNYPPELIENERLEHCKVIGVPKLLIREFE